MSIMESHGTNDFGGEFDLESVAEGFFEKENAFAIVRPIGAFAEPGHLSDVWRQVIRGALARRRFSGKSKPRYGRNHQNEKQVFHSQSSISLADRDRRADQSTQVSVSGKIDGLIA